jgi:hypothetical protein
LRLYLHGLTARVFRSRMTWCDALAFIFGAAVPLTVWFVAGEFVGDLMWAELLASLGSVVLMRAIIAPYDMWRELILHVKELHREMDDKRA